jgi:hypothetical protein
MFNMYREKTRRRPLAYFQGAEFQQNYFLYLWSFSTSNTYISGRSNAILTSQAWNLKLF